ncbi:hypothetical protein TWF694_001444 [Orbilia ellipsospora]|uniref:Apple domain-containing protein n=1 Tax=Orbilia ellipsospora TaxID=2528407 RepID=A0AAV9XTH4_9PEZI
MKSLILLISLGLVSGAILERGTGCNANNCLRAVRASARTAFASADCSSYLLTTVTPATSTSYQTTTITNQAPAVTVTTTTKIFSIVGSTTVKKAKRDPQPITIPAPSRGAALERRQVTVVPSSIPPYASPCSSPAAYVSACSCIGVLPSVTTAPTPVTTTTVSQTVSVTSTATVTVTSTVPVCDPANNYGIIYNGGFASGSPGQSNIGYTTHVFPDITTPAGCCAKCFQQVGCFTYDLILSPGECTLFWLTAGTTTNPSNTNLCPYGVLSEYTNTGDAFGTGPCNMYVGPPL